MDITQHTPTPWVVFNTDMTIAILPDLDDPAEQQKENGGMDIAHLYGDDSPANAKFIVHACNAHASLASALSDAIEIIDRLRQASRKGAPVYETQIICLKLALNAARLK